MTNHFLVTVNAKRQLVRPAQDTLQTGRHFRRGLGQASQLDLAAHGQRLTVTQVRVRAAVRMRVLLIAARMSKRMRTRHALVLPVRRPVHRRSRTIPAGAIIARTLRTPGAVPAPMTTTTSAPYLLPNDAPARDEEDEKVPQALQRQHGGGGEVVLERRRAVQPAVDAVQAAGDPGDEDADGEEQRGAQVRALDGVVDDELAGEARAGDADARVQRGRGAALGRGGRDGRVVVSRAGGVVGGLVHHGASRGGALRAVGGGGVVDAADEAGGFGRGEVVDDFD